MSARSAADATEQPDAKKQKVEEKSTTATTSSEDMSAKAAKYVLYSYWRSGCSWRARIAFEHKKVPFEYHAINLLKGEQKGEEYQKKNAARKVPLLDLGAGRSISQSMAIIDYLEQMHPEPALLPKDPYLRAKALSLAETINADTQPLQNLAVINKVEALAGKEAKMQWAKNVIQAGLEAYESEVASGLAGTYSVGDEVTIADLCLIPQLGTARRFGVDVSAFPTLLRIEGNLTKLPAFIAAHPDKQPDKPKDA